MHKCVCICIYIYMHVNNMRLILENNYNNNFIKYNDIYMAYLLLAYLLHAFAWMSGIFTIDVDFHRIKFDPDAFYEFAVRYGNIAKWHL